VKEFFASVRGEVEEVLEQTSTLLSQMTSYTSVVVGASHAHATILSVQLVNSMRTTTSGHRVLRRFGRQAQSHAELRGDAQGSDGGVAPTERVAHQYVARDAGAGTVAPRPRADLVREA